MDYEIREYRKAFGSSIYRCNFIGKLRFSVIRLYNAKRSNSPSKTYEKSEKDQEHKRRLKMRINDEEWKEARKMLLGEDEANDEALKVLSEIEDEIIILLRNESFSIGLTKAIKFGEKFEIIRAALQKDYRK